jgi:hypothetical protein
MNSSSKTKGIAKANANGQPAIPPVMKYNIANVVLWLFLRLGGSSAYEKANIVIYMAKEEGRKARSPVSEHSKQ